MASLPQQIRIKVRPRSSWEAIDLGLRMLQHWAGPIWRAWFLLLIPLAALCHLLLYVAEPWLIGLILWWLKPLYDRIPLAILSRALFGQVPSLNDTVVMTWRSWREDALLALTWQRFSPTRGFVLPVRRLEGLSGAARSARIRTLGFNSRDAGNAAWLTITCLHLEYALYFGLLALLQFLIPQGIDFSVFSMFEEMPPLWLSLLNVWLWLLAMSIIEPLYIAASFSLYLNRRADLEAWDLELAFRSAAENKPDKANSKLFVTALLATTVGLFLASQPTAGWAKTKAIEESESVEYVEYVIDIETGAAEEAGLDETADVTENDYWALPREENYNDNYAVDCAKLNTRITELSQSERPSEQGLAKLLNSEAFRPCETEMAWVYIGPKDEPEVNTNSDSWLSGFSIGLGTLMQAMLWVLAISGFVLLLFLILRQFEGYRLGKDQGDDPTAPEQMFGLDLRPESLPKKLVEQARELWAAGDKRAALALLYRGALSSLVHHGGVNLGRSQTEGDCLVQVQTELGYEHQERKDYFADLTAAWILTAYGERPVLETQMQRLLSGWERYFLSTWDVDADVLGERPV